MANSNVQGKNKYPVDLEKDKIRESNRLQDQGYVLTDAIKPLLPEGFDMPEGNAGDFASGAGEWALAVAKMFPRLHVTGIDANAEVVQYANAQARVARRDNVEFIKGDITKPFEFPRNHFDLVNARFLAGINDRDQWPWFVEQCSKVLKPGGMLCLTEPETMIVANAPTQDRLNRIGSEMFYDLGKAFARTSIGIAPMLKKFLEDAGFVDVRRQVTAIDFSIGSKYHRWIVQDALELFSLMRGLFLRYMSEDEFNQSMESLKQEMWNPNYRGDWYVMRVWGRKPA